MPSTPLDLGIDLFILTGTVGESPGSAAEPAVEGAAAPNEPAGDKQADLFLAIVHTYWTFYVVCCKLHPSTWAV